MTPIITIAYILLASILLYVMIWTRGLWYVKVPVMLGTIYFGILLFMGIHTYLGWATPDTPPSRFELLNSFIVEDKVVYLTIMEVSEEEAARRNLEPIEEEEKWTDNPWLNWMAYKNVSREPRLYVLPYSRPLHEMLHQADGMLKDGKRVVVEFGELAAEGNGEGEEGEGGEQGENGRRGEDSNSREIRIYELPPVNMGQK